MKTLIIQSSPPKTASTLLVNAIYGLIPELSKKAIIFNNYRFSDEETVRVVKSHDTNLDRLTSLFQSDKYNLFFVCSEREELGAFVDDRYKIWHNVAVLSYEELNETENNPIERIVDVIYDKMREVFQSAKEPIVLDWEGGVTRIKEMNAEYAKIKDKSFSYCHPFYHIHGSHRNRPVKPSDLSYYKNT